MGCDCGVSGYRLAHRAECRQGLGRRRLLGGALGLAATSTLLPWPLRPARADGSAHAGPTPDEALAMLKAGNEDFVAAKAFRGDESIERRTLVARGQHPFAVLVGCSDSRVPPELLFNRGLGELFVIRVAGNTIDQAALGSIEYAVAELGAPLVVVLGHQRCGAVAGAVEMAEHGALFPGSLSAIIEPILPAVLKVRGQSGDLLANAIHANVERMVELLKHSERLIVDPLEAGKLKVVGAVYGLDDGKVHFIA